ncbi:hypothetical protein SNOG_10624 [Parastagonospora nodorum SN15]|uniref:Uncharacterized protein n=1 Tax=Phaeosphaeria nodorum (strain SN15 / ATCC MYA-4574 / FGSC 10173) TaxID=321614 RepID=Q0UC90_PHANO|nr:hypothetical protein SNOG_10624 [Parastagonospora nodorum SN15]EAT82018.1 hypothetical protein SNOG_10624 [Parastagonospora nodorum SN15]
MALADGAILGDHLEKINERIDVSDNGGSGRSRRAMSVGNVVIYFENGWCVTLWEKANLQIE